MAGALRFLGREPCKPLVGLNLNPLRRVHVEAEDRRSFITGVNTNPSNSDIVTSLIALNH